MYTLVSLLAEWKASPSMRVTVEGMEMAVMVSQKRNAFAGMVAAAGTCTHCTQAMAAATPGQVVMGVAGHVPVVAATGARVEVATGVLVATAKGLLVDTATGFIEAPATTGALLGTDVLATAMPGMHCEKYIFVNAQ